LRRCPLKRGPTFPRLDAWSPVAPYALSRTDDMKHEERPQEDLAVHPFHRGPCLEDGFIVHQMVPSCETVASIVRGNILRPTVEHTPRKLVAAQHAPAVFTRGKMMEWN
jgi:hypothetical protein